MAIAGLCFKSPDCLFVYVTVVILSMRIIERVILTRSLSQGASYRALAVALHGLTESLIIKPTVSSVCFVPTSIAAIPCRLLL